MVEIVKIFIDKHLIPTLLSVVFSCLLYVITLDNLFLKMNLSKTIYGVFLFCSCFVIIKFILFIFRKISGHINSHQYQKYLNEEMESRNKKALEKMWSFIDQLDNEDYKTLKKFLNTNNRPIYNKGNQYYSRLKLIDSSVVLKTQTDDPVLGKEKYRLKDEFFEALKYSQEKYGRISHFK